MSSITIRNNIPLGAVIAISSNLTGSHAIPSSGAVDSQGWMYCDGSAIPAGNTVSGNVPNLTDSRFLMGSTSSGTLAGSNTVQATLSGAQFIGHTHNIAHNHQVAYYKYAGGTPELHFSDTAVASTTSFTTSSTFPQIVRRASTDGSDSRAHITGPTSSKSAYSTGALNAPSGSASSASSGSMSTSSTVLFSNGVSSSENNRPLYITVQYIIRVK